MSKREAVRLAKDALGEVSPRELAAFVEANYGLTIKPAIVLVLLGSMKENGALDLNAERAKKEGERIEAEQAEAGKAPKRTRRGVARRDHTPRTAESLTAPKACPACGGDYAFRGRKVVAAEEGPALVETKYRCKACEHEWRVRVPAEVVGPLGVPKAS